MTHQLACLAALLLPLVATAQQPWRFETPRPTLAPRHWTDISTNGNGSLRIGMAGTGSEAVDGRWTYRVPVVPGRTYRFEAVYETVRIDNVSRSVLVRLIWEDSIGQILGAPEYPAALDPGAARGAFGQTYAAPDGATRAKLELIYRWDSDGEVLFQPATLEIAESPAGRPVGLGTIHFRPTTALTYRENLDVIVRYLDDARRMGADFITLGEGINVAATGKSYFDAAEPIPTGPTSEFLAGEARRLGAYIVGGIIERDGLVVYNTAVLFGPDGHLVGKYRKTSLPREEIDGGITPGTGYPVFDTPYGRVGLMICWDVTFPEVARALRLAGAEFILMPIWGGIQPLAEARAIENQIYLVSAGYDIVSGVFDREGNLIAKAAEGNPVAVARVDLNQRTLWPWLGDLHNRIPTEIPVPAP